MSTPRIDLEGPYISRKTIRRALISWIAVCVLATLGCAVQIIYHIGGI